MMLYYFGSIYDDDSEHISETHIRQELVDDPSLAYTRIIVESADPLADGITTITTSDDAAKELRS